MTLMELIKQLHATGLGLDSEVLVALPAGQGQRQIDGVHGMSEGGASAIWILTAPAEGQLSMAEEFFKRLLAQVEAHDDFTRKVRDDIRRGARTSDHRFKL